MCSITFAHSQTAFQGKNSILSQEEILTPFPLKHENNSALTLGNFWATLTADKNHITGDSFLLFQESWTLRRNLIIHSFKQHKSKDTFH